MAIPKNPEETKRILEQLSLREVTSSHLRETLALIADPERNSSTVGNLRGSDIASLAHAMLRILERVERLEGQG